MKELTNNEFKDAPNVDGIVFINTSLDLLLGQIVRVRIQKASEYDLIGEIENEYC